MCVAFRATLCTTTRLELLTRFATLQIEIWKVKKLIKRLEAARGNGTSMISLIIRKFLSRGPQPVKLG